MLSPDFLQNGIGLINLLQRLQNNLTSHVNGTFAHVAIDIVIRKPFNISVKQYPRQFTFRINRGTAGISPMCIRRAYKVKGSGGRQHLLRLLPGFRNFERLLARHAWPKAGCPGCPGSRLALLCGVADHFGVAESQSKRRIGVLACPISRKSSLGDLAVRCVQHSLYLVLILLSQTPGFRVHQLCQLDNGIVGSSYCGQILTVLSANFGIDQLRIVNVEFGGLFGCPASQDLG